MLLGGPANGQMVRVEDEQTAISVAYLEEPLLDIEKAALACEQKAVSYLYWQNDTDKNVFNYAH